MNYLIWVLLTIFYNYLLCRIAVKAGNKFWPNYIWMFVCGAIPTWSLAAYWSKNLIFDGLAYDTTLAVSSVIIFIFLGQGEKFTSWNWAGVALTLIGLILVRIH